MDGSARTGMERPSVFRIDDSLTCARSEVEGIYWRFFAMDVFGRVGWDKNADQGQPPLRTHSFWVSGVI